MMKRYLYYLGVLALILWGCAGPPPEYAPPEDLFIQEVSEIPGVSKEALFNGAKIWVAKSFSSDLDVIQYANREQGVVVGKTSIPHERPSKLGGPERFELRFTVVAETKDEKIRTTFKDLRLMGGLGIDPLLASDMEVIRPKLEESVQALVASYEKKSEMEDW
ncbi:MAG: DUF4468 domain-containing protein [Thermodesulfobacteriota bacterium]